MANDKKKINRKELKRKMTLKNTVLKCVKRIYN